MDVPVDKEASVICINPGKYQLPYKGESVGYIIAADKEVADQIRDCAKNKEKAHEQMTDKTYFDKETHFNGQPLRHDNDILDDAIRRPTMPDQQKLIKSFKGMRGGLKEQTAISTSGTLYGKKMNTDNNLTLGGNMDNKNIGFNEKDQSDENSDSMSETEHENDKIKTQLISDILLTEKICHTTSYIGYVI